MNIDDIGKLAGILTASGLTALEVSEGGLRVRLEKSGGYNDGAPYLPASYAAPGQGAEGAEAAVVSDGSDVVASPTVGVFYSAPSPDAEPFVSIGSRVKKGDVLCIVEAMKLMNEITAERDGEITDVCVKNGAVVEYGQTLFKFIPAP